MRSHDLDDDDVSAELTGASLNKADFDDGRSLVVTLARVDKKVFEAKNGRPAETRRVLTFEGGKLLTLNRVNLTLLAKWFGPHTRDWVGQRVAVYRDDTVMFGGQLTGGWRLRRALKGDPALTAREPEPVAVADDLDDDMPF
jgi:hypothetical protein